MVAVIIILIGVAIIYYKNTIGSDNAKMVRALTQGKRRRRQMLLHTLNVKDVVQKR